MRVEKLESGTYEATTNINGYSLPLRNGTRIPVEIIGYGSTHSEAIEKCLQKVDTFLHPKSEFEKKMDEAEDDYTEYKDNQL